ncbi:hypothetical protein WAI453_008679 [Rhynchosporium graminicola]
MKQTYVPLDQIFINIAALQNSQILDFKGDLRKIITFTCVAITSFTRAEYNAMYFAEGNNAMSFAHQFEQRLAPNT